MVCGFPWQACLVIFCRSWNYEVDDIFFQDLHPLKQEHTGTVHIRGTIGVPLSPRLTPLYTGFLHYCTQWALPALRISREKTVWFGVEPSWNRTQKNFALASLDTWTQKVIINKKKIEKSFYLARRVYWRKKEGPKSRFKRKNHKNILFQLRMHC